MAGKSLFHDLKPLGITVRIAEVCLNEVCRFEVGQHEFCSSQAGLFEVVASEAIAFKFYSAEIGFDCRIVSSEVIPGVYTLPEQFELLLLVQYAVFPFLKPRLRLKALFYSFPVIAIRTVLSFLITIGHFSFVSIKLNQANMLVTQPDFKFIPWF